MEARKLTAREVVDARKVKLGKREVAAILRSTGKIHAMKGTKLVSFDLKRDPPVEKELYEALLGPTGSLRAPAIRTGKTLIVGFNEDSWKKLLK
jgi:arsenate reductase-like glutaredoxin family protein